MLHNDFPLEIKELKEDGTFSGIASVMGVEDLGGDVIEKGAFRKTLQEKSVFPLLWQHDVKEPVGSISAKEWQSKLLVDGKLLLSLPTAQKAYELIKAKITTGLSIGFVPKKKTWEEVDEDGSTKLVRHVQELKLYEVSLVTFPMNEAAQVTRVKHATDEALERRLALIEDKVLALPANSTTTSGAQGSPEAGNGEGAATSSDEPANDHSALKAVLLVVDMQNSIKEVLKHGHS